MSNSAKAVAEELKKEGIEVLEVSEPEEHIDGEVRLKNDFTVQIGFDYIELTKESEGSIFYLSKTTVPDIIEYIKNLKA